MKRIVTYDVKQGHDYQAFYDYVEQMRAEKITESTYLFDTDLGPIDFANKIRSLFKRGDVVVYISYDSKAGTLFYKRL